MKGAERGMWRNYVKVGWHSLVRNKTYAFFNIFGLALGLAACLLLLIYVRYESSYDSWLPDAERIFQVQTVSTDPDESELPLDQYTHGVITETFARDFPQIEAIARLDEVNPVLLRNGEPSFAPMLLTDESFFRIIQLPFLRGDRATALRPLDALAISRSEAIARFGSLDVVGETVTAVRRGEQYNLRVTGVFEDLPKNTHMHFSMIGRLGDEERAECG